MAFQNYSPANHIPISLYMGCLNKDLFSAFRNNICLLVIRQANRQFLDIHGVICKMSTQDKGTSLKCFFLCVLHCFRFSTCVSLALNQFCIVLLLNSGLYSIIFLKQSQQKVDKNNISQNSNNFKGYKHVTFPKMCYFCELRVDL